MKLANEIGISDTALSKIEKGKVESIKIETGKKLCEILEVSFNDLFEIELPVTKEIENQLDEFNRLKEANKQLLEQLEDKRKAYWLVEETLEYFSHLYLRYLSEIQLFESDISAKDFFKEVDDSIRQEKGDFGHVLFDKKTVRIKFFSESELALMKEATEKAKKQHDKNNQE